ncbi:MAG TPA: lipid A-modifier LpxR family protein [Phenylobacterium sp.]
MRLLAGLAIAFGCVAATDAAAQEGIRGDADALPYARPAGATDFAPKLKGDDFSNLIEREQFTVKGDPVRWRTDTVTLGETKKGSVDSLRLSVGGALRSPTGLPPNLDQRAQFDTGAYEVAVTRDWAPVRFDAGEYDVSLTPRTGLGMSNAGGQAEAGATLTVGQKRDDIARDRLSDLGIGDGRAYGDKGRWYLFAAASGRAVGLNVLRSEAGWNRDGWTTDASTALIGDAHVGVGYRKGAMQTSFGYIHREVKGEHMIFGERTREDSVVAFSLTIKPER